MSGAIAVLGSNYFLNTILATDPTKKYWYVIPALMRVNRELREKILDVLPVTIKDMLLILGPGDHVIKISPSVLQIGTLKLPKMKFCISMRDNCREILTKLCGTGALPEYIRFHNAICPGKRMQSWELLAKIYDDYMKYEPPVAHNKAHEYFTKNAYHTHSSWRRAIFHKYNESGAKQSDIIAKLKNRDIFALKTPDGTIQCYTAPTSPAAMYQVYTITRNGRTKEIRNINKLPVLKTPLHTYLPFIWFHDEPKFVARFYTVYGARMPTTGAWDMLLMSSLFDLDLHTLVEAVSRSQKHNN